MSPPEQLLAVHLDGRSYSFHRSERHTGSFYGGPLQQTVTGATLGPARLHHVASLVTSSLSEIGAPRRVFDLPLAYGFRFEGCSLQYRFTKDTMEVLDITPHQSSADWPYFDYAPLLPYLPIEAAPSAIEDWNGFAARFPGLPHAQPAELVAVVPPAFLTGHSLWGRAGDLAGTCVVFECELSQNLVRSYTVRG
ncbi:MAG: hypothetical protein JWP22_1738 [Ramlibacter sp.]|nr:hypothetical protein [Ramlibacter sp.]